jgi:iron complex outermembrane receptor protein
MPISVAARRPLAAIWLFACFIMFFGTPTWGQQVSARVADFDIPAQPMAMALVQFGKQAGMQMVSSAQDVAGVSANVVRGHLTLREAVDRLLDGTGLVATFNERDTIVIKPGDERKKGRSALLSNAETEVYKAEAIHVTAQKRDELALDVPISIMALDGKELQRRKLTNIDDLAMAVPDLSVRSDGGFQRQIAIRGISNGYGNSPLIGMYMDEASVTSGLPYFQPDLRTYDLARVEVLRGPQGTLFGEGSVGGTIRFITRDPVLDRFGMTADVAALFTERGAPGQRIESMINVPVIDNQLGLRIAGTFDHEGGWIDQPAANKKDFNGANLADVRIKGLWLPTPELAVHAMALVHRNDTAPARGEDESGNFTQSFNLTTTPAAQDDYNLYNVTLTYDFPAIQVLNTTSYLDQNSAFTSIGSRQPVNLGGPQPVIFDVYTDRATYWSHVLSEELRLTSTGLQPLQWTLGGSYRDSNFDYNIPFAFGVAGPPGSPLPPAFSSHTGTKSKSSAVFGDASYKLGGGLTIGAGVRAYHDSQDDISGQSASFHATNPRIYASYKVSDQINTYASAAKGFRSGGFNAVNGQPNFQPESLWTYELGAKAVLLGGRVGVDAAIFYSDYNDYQALVIVPPTTAFIVNAGKARLKGVDWGITWQFQDYWTLIFNGNYIKSEFYRIDQGAPFVVGDPLEGSPRYRYGLSLQRDFDWSKKPGFVRIDYTKTGPIVFGSEGLHMASYSDTINMLNFNASLQWNGSLSLSVFGQNLLDERGFLDALAVLQQASRPRPRTLGVGFSVAF